MSDNERVYGDNDTDTMLNAGASLAEVKHVHETPFVVVPDGYIVRNLENMMSEPSRRKGKVLLDNVDSFVNFISLYHSPGSSAVFADLQREVFTAVLNYHGVVDIINVNGWGDFRAELVLKETSQWKHWIKNNKNEMNQLEFADFIEANIKDIADPNGADIMEMITALKVKKKAEFISVVDQATGMKSVQYSEETRGESVKGHIDFFGQFTLGIKPFLGSEAYSVPCRLRFSITSNNKLRVYYQIINPDIIIEAAFDEELEKIKSGMGKHNIPIFNGGCL